MAFEHSRIPSNPKRKRIMYQIYLVRYKYLMSDQGNYLCIIVTHTNNLTHILLDVALSTLFALGHLPCKNCCIRFIYCNILYHSNVRHIVYETMVIRVQSRPKRNEAVRLFQQTMLHKQQIWKPDVNPVLITIFDTVLILLLQSNKTTSTYNRHP